MHISNPEQIDMDPKQRIFWLTIPPLLVGILLLAKLNTLDVVTKDNYSELGYYQLSEPRKLKAFSLLDQNGKSVNNQSLVGQTSLIFFGFTYCPDVCPTTLSILNMAIQDLKVKPQVVMISVDPERDNPAALSAYMAGFNPDFTAYTGSIDETKSLAKNLDSDFRKVNLESDNNWTIDHTANIIVINKHGEYQGLIRPPHQIANIATILELIAREG